MAANPESLEAIAERLRLTRKALDYPTDTAFIATIPGMYSQKWSNYMSGNDRIPVDVALFLCQRHHLSLDWIYRGHKEALPLRLAQRLTELEAPQTSPKPRRALKRS